MSESERFESEHRLSIFGREDLPETVRAYVDTQSRLFTDKLVAVGADDYADLYKKYKAGEVTRAKLDEIGVFLKRISRTAESGLAALEWDKYECLQTLEQEHHSRISAVAIVGDRFVLGTAESNFASIWDLQTGERRTLANKKGQQMSVSSMGIDRAAFIKPDGGISVVDVESGTESYLIDPIQRGFLAGVHGVSHDELLVDRQSVFLLWNISAQQSRVINPSIGTNVASINFVLPSGDICITEMDRSSFQNRLKIISIHDESIGLVQNTWTFPNEDILYVDEMVDGNVVYANYEHIFLWNVIDNTQREINIPDGMNANIRSMCALADGNVAVGYKLEGNVEIWDIRGEEIKVVRVLEGHTNAVRSLSVMDDGRLVSGSEDGTVRIWGIR